MSEIDRQSAGFSFLSSFSEQDNLLLSTTPGSVAAAISSALETAAEDNTIAEPDQNHHYNHNFHYHQQDSYDNNNDSFNHFGDFVKPTLVNNCSTTITTTSNSTHQQHIPPTLLPVAPLRQNSCYVEGGTNLTADHFNSQLLLTTSNSGNRTEGGVGGSGSTSHLSSVSAAGNHVSCDQQFRSSSVCSQFHHQISTAKATSFSRSPSQMADRQEFSSNGGGSFPNNTPGSVRDKSDNRETYPVSHCKEKSTSDNREVDSGGGGCRVFKPSSKIIDLPEKSTSSSNQNHHQHTTSHHHLHHSRSKDSKIPVGIAVAWQRLVTTSSTNPTNSSTMTTKADSSSGHYQKSKVNSVCSSSLSSPSSAVMTKYPSRPSSASSLKSVNRLSSGSGSPALYSSNGYSTSTPSLSGIGVADTNNSSDIISSSNTNNNRPMSACGDVNIGGGAHVPFCPSPASPALSRPLPSSSVPPNLGYPTGYSSQYPPHPYHHRTAVSPYLDSYSYAAVAAAATQRPFAVPSPLSSPHHHSSHPSFLAGNGNPYWALDSSHPHPPASPVSMMSPGIPTSPGVGPAEYIQQFSLQHQHMQQLHTSHHLHQQQRLLATTASRHIPPCSPPSSSPINPYLPFLYPQDAASASFAAAMNKNPYFDHYFQQQQHQSLGHFPQSSSSISSAAISSGGNNIVASTMANSANHPVTITKGQNNCSNATIIGNDNSGSSNPSGAASSSVNITHNTHRAIPMQVASPINRTSIPLLSDSGGLRTPTPTTTSSSSLAYTTTVTSSPGSSAFSSFPTSSSVSASPSRSSSATTATSNENALDPSSQSEELAGESLASSQELCSLTTATVTTSATATSTAVTGSTSTNRSSPSLFLLHHQQQHPHLFSSGGLSPKSFTSSSPSPVTLHDFNSGLNVVISNSSANNSTTTNTNMSATARKNATPSPISLTPTRALLSPFPPGSPYSIPSPVPGNNNNISSYKESSQWKEDASSGARIKPIPINGHTRETHNSGGSTLTTPPPLSSPLLSLAHLNNRKTNNACNGGKVINVPTPLSSPSQKHDFKRLDSLIERRDSESFSPLVLIPQHSPANSTTSSLLDGSLDEQQQVKLAALTAEEKSSETEAGSKSDNIGEEQTFCISVKLENHPAGESAEEIKEEQAACQQHSSNNGANDSLKVSLQSIAADAGDKSEAKEPICMVKPDVGTMTRDQVDALGKGREGVKVERESPASNVQGSPPITIVSCDDANNVIASTLESNITTDENAVSGESSFGGAATAAEGKNQHGGSYYAVGKVNNAKKEIVEGNDVPESPLPYSCQSKRYNDKIISKSTDKYFKASTSAAASSSISLTMSQHNSTSQFGKVQDVSFTSGYSSSQEDLHLEFREQPQQKNKLSVTGKCETNKAKVVKGTKGGKPSLKTLKKDQEKMENEKMVQSEGSKKQAKKNKESGDNVGFKLTPVHSGAVSRKKLLPVGKAEIKSYEDTAAAVTKRVISDFLNIVEADLSAADCQGKKTKKSKNSNLSYSNEKAEEKTGHNKRGYLGVEKAKNKKGPKLVRSEKVGKRGKGEVRVNKKHEISPKNTDPKPSIPQPTSWVAPMSPPLTNSGSQQFTNAKSDDSRASYIVSPNMTGISGGDTILSSGTSFSASSPQQPMSVILQSSSAVQSPSQVTFLITSPSQSVGNTSPLRIPAYIPRSGATTAVMASADDLVGSGESYNGPATLTLHRDVDALSAASPQPAFYQPPPAITIQYHHSAPATPLTMEAASPSSLDLLATVAQEFGTREDLGKRLSIDGGSSCNASSVGESPPMSPQKSSVVYHPPPQHYTPHTVQYGAASTASQNQNPWNVAKTDIIATNVTAGSSRLSTIPIPSLHEKIHVAKRPKSPKKQGKATSNIKNSKTSNSITLKLSSKKALKVGKKEKRTVSDSAFYGPPVVLLKIPQVPGLGGRKSQNLSMPSDKMKKGKEKVAKEKKAKEKVAKEKKAKEKVAKEKVAKEKGAKEKVEKVKADDTIVKTVATGLEALANSRSISLNNNQRMNIDALKGKTYDNQLIDVAPKTIRKKKSDILSKKELCEEGNKSKRNKKTNLVASCMDETASKSKPLGEKKEKKKRTSKNKLEGESLPLTTPGSTSSLSPLSIFPMTGTEVDQTSSSASSPTKEKCPSSFLNPPERISAFAKQVISRRASAATTSPTKSLITSSSGPTCTSQAKQHQQTTSACSPVPQKQQKLLPNSPTGKMPQLKPFDAALSTPTTTAPKQHTFSAAVVAAAVAASTKAVASMSSSAAAGNKKLESSSIVPKTLNLTRFSLSSKISSPRDKNSLNSQLPPVPLDSTDDKKKREYCDVNANSRLLSEQDTKKTDNIVSRLGHRSPKNEKSGSVSISTKNKANFKSRKDNGRLEKRRIKDNSGVKEEVTKRRKSQASKNENDEVNKSKTIKKKLNANLLSNKKVPKITVTQSSSHLERSPTSFQSFSPLTPPLTGKTSVLEIEEGHKSAFACLQVPGGNSSTPCSSLASVSPATDGETETENENDLNNVWVADPMFAVSAIKLSNISSAGSNQPTDAEEFGDDDIHRDNTKSSKRGKKDNSPAKFSRFTKRQQQIKANSASTERYNQQLQLKDREQGVKSPIKAAVHFKPKLLTGSKKRNSGLRPCLAKAKLKECTATEEEEDENTPDEEDLDIEDLEVANITTQNAPKSREKRMGSSSSTATSSGTAALSNSGTTSATGSNKKRRPSINRNSASYLTTNSSSSFPSKKHHTLSTKEIMTKVFSRKVSPELSERGDRRTKKRKSSGIPTSSNSSNHKNLATDMDADDEDDEQDYELGSIDERLTTSQIHGKEHSQQNNAQLSMTAAAAAVVVNSNIGNNSLSGLSLSSNSVTAHSSSSCSLSASSLAQLSMSSPSSSTSSMKKPMKRSARSSTTSSSTSTKSSGRGNKGHGGGNSVSAMWCGVHVTNTRASIAAASSQSSTKDETQLPGKVELNSVDELVDEMRILTDIQGLFYTGRLNALQPPDVYGVTLDNERGAPPHLIFSAEEVLEKCLREKKPQAKGLRSGLRICAYWSPQYSGLYPGRVSTDFSEEFDPDTDLIPIEFDDGDTGMIKLKEIRLLSTNHPIREYDPNPLLTLEKKHRKRRHSSATGTSGGCTGDHEEPDCGEPYCAKVGNVEETEDEDNPTDSSSNLAGSSSKMLYWAWSGLGYKRSKKRRNGNKEFFHGIQRGNEVINVGDAALFISSGNERPFIGRVERFWERNGKKMVSVRWFYHPEEVKASAKRLSNLKYPGALFESPHIDQNDVQTIAKKCDVLPFEEFKQRLSSSSSGSLRVAKLSMKSSSKPRDMYYVAGFYDPYNYNLTLNELK